MHNMPKCNIKGNYLFVQQCLINNSSFYAVKCFYFSSHKRQIWYIKQKLPSPHQDWLTQRCPIPHKNSQKWHSSNQIQENISLWELKDFRFRSWCHICNCYCLVTLTLWLRNVEYWHCVCLYFINIGMAMYTYHKYS